MEGSMIFGLSAVALAGALFHAPWRGAGFIGQPRASEALYCASFEQAAVGLAQVASDGRLMRGNARLGRMFGYPDGVPVGLTFR